MALRSNEATVSWSGGRGGRGGRLSGILFWSIGRYHCDLDHPFSPLAVPIEADGDPGTTERRRNASQMPAKSTWALRPSLQPRDRLLHLLIERDQKSRGRSR